jgi:hypothetical protein
MDDNVRLMESPFGVAFHKKNIMDMDFRGMEFWHIMKIIETFKFFDTLFETKKW